MATRISVTDARLRRLFTHARLDQQVAAELADALRGLTDPERTALRARYTTARPRRDPVASRALLKLSRPAPTLVLTPTLARLTELP